MSYTASENDVNRTSDPFESALKDDEAEAVIKQKVAKFESFVVKHEHLARVLNRIMFHLSHPASIEVVVLIGPAGIGKSLLMGHISKTLKARRHSSRPDDADYRPVIHTVAMASGHRQFSFKSLYVGGLKNVGDPMFDRHLGVDEVYLRSLKLDTTAKLRIRLEDEMKFRGTQYWLLDEAQHAVFGGKSGSTGDQFDVLKSITQMTNCMFLLAGPCNIDAQLLTSSQLARRSVIIPFNRYRHDRKADVDEFGSVANQFMLAMELHERPPSEQVLGMLFDGSAGCIGILKDWLTRSYAMAMQQSSDLERVILTEEILRETRMPASQMETVMEDIRRLDDKARWETSDATYSNIVRGVSSVQPTKPDCMPTRAAAPKRQVPVGTRNASRNSLSAPGMTT